MSNELSYSEQAADALLEAFAADNLGEQTVLLEKAVRLHRLAVAAERAKLAEWVRDTSAYDTPSPVSADET